MKKGFLLMGIVLFALTGCHSDTANRKVSGENEELRQEVSLLTAEKESLETALANEKAQQSSEAEAEKAKNNVKLSAGQPWTVDGLFTLQVDSVKAIAERNTYTAKNPAQVVLITYAYQNIGYVNNDQELYLAPSHVVDSSGEMASPYPADIDVYPQPTPVGAKMVGAQAAFSLNHVSKEILISFETYDRTKGRLTATFTLPVSSEE